MRIPGGSSDVGLNVVVCFNVMMLVVVESFGDVFGKTLIPWGCLRTVRLSWVFTSVIYFVVYAVSV